MNGCNAMLKWEKSRKSRKPTKVAYGSHLKDHPNGTCNYICELIANICSVRSVVRHICRVTCNQILHINCCVKLSSLQNATTSNILRHTMHGFLSNKCRVIHTSTVTRLNSI